MSAIALELALIVFLLIINGIFSMSEMAVVSARKTRLQHRAEEGDAGARAALDLAANPSNFLSTVQVGITLVGVLAGAFGGARISQVLAEMLRDVRWVGSHAEPVAFGLVVSAITYLSLIVGELVPKQIALGDPERIASFVAAPMTALARVAAPAVWLLETSSRLVLRLLGRGEEPEQRVTEEEIRMLVAEAESAGVVEPQETRMIARVMRLGDRSVRAVMTPRPEVDWVDLAPEPPSVLERLRASPHARLPATRGGGGGIDAAVGVLHAKDVLHQVTGAGGGGADLAALVQAAPTVHDHADG